MNHKLYRIILAVIVLTVTAYYFYYNSLGFLPNFQCVFNRATGLYCPGCGGQRAFHALLHGHILTAAHNNLLIFLVLPIVSIKLFEELIGKKIFSETFYSRKFLLPLLVFFILFSLLRNIPAEPFKYLAPIAL